jgi:hypothetical protein
LKYRDVEEASQRIATRRKNDEFSVGLSRLADIENRGTVPSIYRLYSLCAIYRLDFGDTLRWYGIELGQLPLDAAKVAINQTHLVDFDMSSGDGTPVDLPVEVNPKADLRNTALLNRHIQRWGKLPIVLLNSFDLRRQRYGFVGTDDWSMYPILAPGAFVQIDETKRRILNEGWTNEFDRPIYFLEHRHGFRCCWCSERDGLLIAQAHSASQVQPEVFNISDVDVIGQVVGVAKRLDLGKRRHTRS